MKRLALTAGLLAGLCLPAVAQDAPKPDAPKPDAPKPDAPKPGDAKPDAPKPGDTDGDGKLSKKERQAKRRAARQAKLRQKNPNDPRLRELAPDAPEAKALDDLLQVAPNYAKDGTVLLTYTFRQPEQINDWVARGFDMAEEVRGRGRGRRRRRAMRKGKPNRLALGVSGRGLLLHKLHLTEEYTITFDLAVDRTSSRSDLVVFAGRGGVRWASQLVKKTSSRFSRIAGRVNKDAFVRGRAVKIKLAVKDNVLTVFVNGAKLGETKKLKNKLDGVVGIYATDMLLFVNSIEIRGKVAKSKL